MGETEFFEAVQLICLKKENLIEDKLVLSAVTNFQVLMKVLEQSKKKSIVLMLLNLLFPKYTVIITKNSIILNMTEPQQTILIDENNFDDFQEIIGEVLCIKTLFPSDVNYKPVNAAARKIAEKLAASRKKVAKQKGEGEGDSVLTRYISILTVAQVVSITECLELNLFQLFDLLDRYMAYTEWRTDQEVRLAGGKPEEKVESWMRNLHPNN